jgi:hypothetical protein
VSGVLRALVATLLIEVPIVALGFPKRRLRLILVAIAANTLTNLTLNLLLPAIPFLRPHRLLLGETLAVVVEALAYVVAAGPGSFGRALVVSGIGNALSFELGGFVAAAI